MTALDRIRQYVQGNRYRVKPHATRHMMEEGFEERHIIEVLMNGVILEEYPAEHRCLIAGEFHWSTQVSSSLHVICDYGQPDRVDLVTAYIPQAPVWISPARRGKKL